MAELKTLLAVFARSSHALQLTDPEEPWLLFPLARPARGMPARMAAAGEAGPPAAVDAPAAAVS